jgi:hypothetical protein
MDGDSLLSTGKGPGAAQAGEWRGVKTAKRSEAWRSADVFYRGLKWSTGGIRCVFRHPSLFGPLLMANRGLGATPRSRRRTLVDLNHKVQLFRHDGEKVGEGEGERKGREGASDTRQQEREEGRAGQATVGYLLSSPTEMAQSKREHQQHEAMHVLFLLDVLPSSSSSADDV